ncbi:LysR family transcriptional regulator [Blastomonas sp. UPD001]|uniref:LysR family transcriptional regulator n=1 Tax=Blastomonas sp. UPD001 TaxID=2217673 RepID=UPI000E355DAE|nr:LysR family transcriptional regulator [Blastomonas sp. UPD001]
MKQYDLNLLPALEVLLDERSVSRAAVRLGIGQPAMSAALARLRKLFDDPILVRGTRGMEPTARAQTLAGPLRATLAAIATMIEPDQPFEPVRAKRAVRMSGGDYAGMTLLPCLANRLAENAPGIDLRFRYLEKDAALTAIDDGTIDLALLVNDDLAPRFGSDVLIEETFVGAARRNHPLLKGDISLPAFSAARHLLVTERGDATGCVDAVLATWGLERRIAITVPSAALVADVLHATDLIATLPRRAAERLAENGAIQIFDLPLDVPGWRMRLVWSKRLAADPVIGWFRTELSAVAGTV